ncbi:MAG: hypothetical protein KGY78_07050 [Anaerolineae bacterium]|nr:hypothetical protein [Anaerolineae bacterium]
MAKGLRVAGLLIILLSLAAPVAAQGPILPQHSDPAWQAQYWANKDLSGAPVLTRDDPNMDFDWGLGSPAAGVPADGFSARWTRYIDVTPGTYRFSATSDDGIRVWIDDELMLDQWTVHAPKTDTFTRYLGEGHHLIKVEYFENTERAVAKLSWTMEGAEPPPTPTGEWNAQYFNNMVLSGPPALTRKESMVNFDWGSGSPAPGTINPEHFSARWTRTVNLSPAMYHFELTIDDGARMWVNGHRLVDAWYDQGATTYTGDIHLSGEVTIEIEYYENQGFATAQLSWDGDGGPPPPPAGGTVIVDDRDAGFTKGGAAAGWRYVDEGYNNSLTWTRNNDYARSNYNWARWYPQLQSRYYEVFAFIPYRYTTTSHARYWVRHADGYTLRIVDQSAQGDRWVSLGTYRFRGDGSGYVSLSDVTYEPRVTRLLAFDAVKWEPR